MEMMNKEQILNMMNNNTRSSKISKRKSLSLNPWLQNPKGTQKKKTGNVVNTYIIGFIDTMELDTAIAAFANIWMILQENPYKYLARSQK